LYYFLRLPFVRALGEHNFEGFGFLWRLVGCGEERRGASCGGCGGVCTVFFSVSCELRGPSS